MCNVCPKRNMLCRYRSGTFTIKGTVHYKMNILVIIYSRGRPMKQFGRFNLCRQDVLQSISVVYDESTSQLLKWNYQLGEKIMTKKFQIYFIITLGRMLRFRYKIFIMSTLMFRYHDIGRLIGWDFFCYKLLALYQLLKIVLTARPIKSRGV